MRPGEKLDLTVGEIHRRIGHGGYYGDAVRKRMNALLEPPVADDDSAGTGDPGDVALAAAVIVRLDGAATVTTIAAWMGWTIERCVAAVGDADRRLASCGLRIGADVAGRLRVREYAQLRVRPQRLASEVLAGLDDPAYRHGLAHLARGDHCSQKDAPPANETLQVLLDLGAATLSSQGPPHPAGMLAAAFAAARPPDDLSPLDVRIEHG
jgi:hypothetical protein